MKTKTFSILFALVMVLSMSVGVFAQDALYDETWDENTVLTVFSDMDLVFPDLFADEDSDYLWADGPSAYPNAFPTDSAGNYWAKAPIAPGEGEESAEITGKFTYDPCGDGLVKFEVDLSRLSFEDYVAATSTDATWSVSQDTGNKYGPEKTSYIRNIYAFVSGDGEDEWQRVNVKKCMARGEEDCDIIHFNSKGEAKLKGYLQTPFVFDGSAERKVELYIQFSNYFTALWQVPSNIVKVTGETVATKKDYCQESLAEFAMGGLYSVRAKYDQHTGEARFQAVVRNLAQESNKEAKYKAKQNYVIPADVIVLYTESNGIKDVLKYGDPAAYWTDPKKEGVFEYAGEGEDVIRYEHYTDYTCKYTIYNNSNGAPRTDYCKFGEGIALPANALIRFDITIDHLSTNILKAYDEGNIPFNFRVGGMTYLVGGPIDTKGWYDGEFAITDATDGEESTETYMAAFAPVDYPCPYISRMQVKDPLNKFATFFEMDADPAIKPSGAYGVYEGGLWGLYQKCGKFAYMAVRLKNDGLLEEVIDLSHVAVAVNGGTPMAWNWVLATQEPVKNKIFLDSGEEVILIGRAKVTDIRSQLNADTAMTGAINFLDYGFYITGKVFSDHNNTNCVAAPN